MSNLIVNTTDATFEQDVLQSEFPVLLDFWAPWCGPCKMLTPMLERLAVQYAGRVRIVKLNVDDNPETTKRFQIRGIPRLMLFAQGELQSAQVTQSQAGLTVLFDNISKPAGVVATAAATAASAPAAAPVAAPAGAALAASVVPSFGGDPARKADYLQRLRAATFDGDHSPSESVTTSAGAFAGTTGGPEGLGQLLDVVWWLNYYDPARKAQAHDRAVSLIEAIPVGIDLNRISLLMANWLLHDPETGIACQAPTDVARALCDRLAALHQRELDGERVPESEWSVLQHDVVRLAPPPVNPDHAGAAAAPALSPEQKFLAVLEYGTMPLADAGLNNLFNIVYGRTLNLEIERSGCWSAEENQQYQSVYEATRDALSSALGERPADEDAEAAAQWDERSKSIGAQVQPAIQKSHPELQARRDAVERFQKALGSRVADAVQAQFLAQCAAVATR
ncbi:thioredoxin [Cupriavidus sp. 30B13]|uniref:thioredoxin n=1 Tax=Cupriavidus sp. 30B13 TaxID=3384241 RepID=UPI003B90C832